MPAAYFHRDYVVAGICCLGFGGACAYVAVYDEGLLSLTGLAAVFSTGIGGLFLLLAWRYRFAPDIAAAQRQTDGAIRIEKECLRRYRRYPFGAASIVKQPLIDAADIDEVDVSSPVHVVIHQREVIFLEDNQREVLRDFALRHGIPIRQRPDIWSMIAKPYLDTETSDEDHEALFRSLEAQGVSREEVVAARRKISFHLLAATYLTWEWVCYDHSDVLRLASPVWGRKQFYWYTMELALRNFPGEEA